MEKEIYKKELAERATQFGVMLSEEQQNQFYNYMELLLEWNEKLNLTAITDQEQILTKHFIDSLSIAPYINLSDKILDIGTGAGFPGIPLKIALPQNSFTLLDSLNKRINFLNVIIQELKLKNIKAIHGRAEEFNKINGERENYEIVVSRAVAKLNVLLEYMLPFVKKGGKCICMKSIDIDEELKEAEKAIKTLGGRIEKIDSITLENTDIQRKIVIIKKVQETPKKYPRKAGTPLREPI